MATSLILLNKLHTTQYIILGSKTIDIHMSNNESLDEETKRILAEVNADAQSGTNDSKESDKKKKKTIEWETNTIEDDDSEW